MAYETLWWRDQNNERTWRVQGASPGPLWTLAPPCQRADVHDHTHWMLPGVGTIATNTGVVLKRIITSIPKD